MTDFRSKTCLVYDNGLFVEFARELAKDFGKVLYYVPWQSGFPKSNIMLIGQGIPNIRRVDSFWNILDEIDLFVFPDVYEGPLQVHLQGLGKRVWGGRMGEDLELCRVDSKEHLKSIGIDIGPYKVIKGLDALRDFLKKHDNQYVKISRTRGDMETFHAENYDLIEPKLDELEYMLGAKKKIMEFIVEEAIEDAVEIGYDGYTIDGKFPKNAMAGIEVKDKGLVMKTLPYASLPEEVRGVNDKLAPTFRQFGYRGFFSSEIRITRDLTPYVIDPCARMGSPPGELFQLMVRNWADIVWEGSVGTVVEPIFDAKWGAELLLLSSWADKNWQPVEFPKSIRDNVKLRNLTIIEGKYYVVPQAVGLPEIGAVVATGDSMQAAIDEVRRLAEKVDGHYLEVVPDSLDEAKDQFDKLKEFGIKI
jgi:hypothetical protein